ncbi:MAG: phasin family protein [Kiloniellales bacterium]
MAKAKAKTGNPFLDADLGNIMDFGKLAGQFKFPGVDTTALIESQRRNIEAITKANQVAFEGAQAIVQRQVEILSETLDETTKAVQAFSQTGKPEDIWAKQADLVKEAYEHGLSNLRELTELSAKANSQAADLLSHRVTDGLDELKGAFKPVNGGAEKAAL